MNTLIKLLESPLEAVCGFILVVYGIKEAIEIFKYFKNRGKEIYDKDAQCEDVEAKMNKATADIEAIQDTLIKINDTLDNIEQDRKNDMKAQGRAMLYDLYNQLKDKPSLTYGESEVVQDVFDRYEAAGGNGTFKRLAHALLSKPIDEN